MNKKNEKKEIEQMNLHGFTIHYIIKLPPHP